MAGRVAQYYDSGSMKADSSANSAGNAAPRHVEEDLPCARCGYNLRTLAWDARCPECGTPVLRSGRPLGFRFASLRSERLVQIGIGVLAAAFLVEVAGRMAMTGAFRVFFVAPPFVYWVGFWAWVYGGWLARFAMFAAILLITQPFASERERFRARLTLATLIIAFVGVLGLLFDLVLRFTGLTVAIRQVEVGVTHLSGLCSCTAYALACVHLVLRVDRHRERTLWLLLLPVVAAQVLVLYLPLAGAVLYFSGGASLASTSGPKSAILWLCLLVDMLWWQKNVVAAANAALLLVLLLFVRRLRAAPREVP
jgi:DNA-directed RNA polymerase subunit RPC12/RpoP